LNKNSQTGYQKLRYKVQLWKVQISTLYAGSGAIEPVCPASICTVNCAAAVRSYYILVLRAHPLFRKQWSLRPPKKSSIFWRQGIKYHVFVESTLCRSMHIAVHTRHRVTSQKIGVFY